MSNPNVETEKTFVMLKPDALERGLAGEIIGRLERKGLRLTKIELRTVSKELAARHYAEHLEKAFYPELEAYVTRGPVLATIWEGRKAITVVRGLVGATGDKLALDFKWSDNPTELVDPISLCTAGDTAPNRRFNYRFLWERDAE